MAKNLIERTLNIELEPGLNAIIRIARKGQQLPYEGNDVVVKADIILPCGSNSYLDERLQFRGLLVIAGESLFGTWGSLNKEGTQRTKTNELSAPKWVTAFNKAEEWATAEINKLILALSERRKALLNAEEEEE